MLIIVDYMLKNKWLILNLVAECLYLCAQLYMKLVNVYCELLLMISSFSPKQSTVSFFSPFVAFDYLRDCAKTKKKTLCLFPHFSHLSNLHCHHIFLHFFFLLVIETAVNMESLSLSSKSCYLSWSLGPYTPTKCYRGSTENAVYTILN